MDAQAKEIKNKVMCEINSFTIVYLNYEVLVYCVETDQGKNRLIV
jgi:hypothetical protein